MRARQHRGREMRRRRHDVGRDQREFHHRAMQGRIVAARPPVADADRMIGRADQDAGAAGQIADLQPQDIVRIRPVALQPAHRQFREQRRRGRMRIERGQEFAVRDQALKQPSGHILQAGGPDRGQVLRQRRQPAHHFQRDAVGEMRQQLQRDVEDGVVVHFAENAVPARHQPHAGKHTGLIPELGQRRNSVLAGDRIVEAERVGENGHRHAGRLLAVLLLQLSRDLFQQVRRQPVAQVQRRFHDALLELPGALLDTMLG